MKGAWTYARAGVDIDEKSKAIDSLVEQLRFRRRGRGRMVDARGQFTGLIDFDDVYLTLCTDGVGTKILVAKALDRWDTVGIDCIAMNANDTICVGSEPMAFVDYIALDRPNRDLTEQIGRGLERGAELANLDIVGGEIAVVPEMVSGVDISGTCLGFVPKGSLVDGSRLKVGDAIIGVPSSGIHSNGLTLARRVLQEADVGLDEIPPELDRSIGEELLEPTEIYVRRIVRLLELVDVRGMVNITGGGVRNLLRLRPGVRFEIDSPLPVPPVFGLLKRLGGIDDHEMYQTFNMGMGFAVICPPDEVEEAIDALGSGQVVGHVTNGKGVALVGRGLEYLSY